MLRELSRRVMIQQGVLGVKQQAYWSKSIERQMSSTKNLPILTLYTKEECSLCDIAKEILVPFKHRYTFEEVDITKPENQDWFDSYKYDIPVFHLNGKFLMKHKVNTRLLERKLCEIETADS